MQGGRDKRRRERRDARMTGQGTLETVGQEMIILKDKESDE